LKTKTRNRVIAGLDLANVALEEIPAVGAIMKGAQVTKDAYKLATGKKFPLPPGVISMERMNRRIPKRFP